MFSRILLMTLFVVSGCSFGSFLYDVERYSQEGQKYTKALHDAGMPYAGIATTGLAIIGWVASAINGRKEKNLKEAEQREKERLLVRVEPSKRHVEEFG